MKSFLYLIQGCCSNVIKYKTLNNIYSDVITLTYDYEISQIDFPSIKNIYLPNSTWAEGRNFQLNFAKNLSNNYEYYIFMDDDVEFKTGSFLEFQNLLSQTKPAIGIPLLDIIKHSNRYNNNLSIQHPVAFDQAIQAFHRIVINDNIVLPYVTNFDEMSWWYSCEINTYLSLSFYLGKIMQYNDFLVENKGHNWDIDSKISLSINSKYKGGVSKEGLDAIRTFIKLKYPITRKIVNSLFHDNTFPKIIYIDKTKINFRTIIDSLYKLKFKTAISVTKQYLKYQFNLIINLFFNNKNLINIKKIKSIV